MDCQTHAIGKAIRPLFAEPVTIGDFLSTAQKHNAHVYEHNSLMPKWL